MTEELLGENIDEKISRALPLSQNEVGIEPFGLDLDTIRISVACAAYFYRWWFRVECEGINQVPDGRVLLVSNHAGQLPIDGVMLAMALALDKDCLLYTSPSPRDRS